MVSCSIVLGYLFSTVLRALSRFVDMQEIINFPTFASSHAGQGERRPGRWEDGFRYLLLVSLFDLWTGESVDGHFVFGDNFLRLITRYTNDSG